MKGTEGIDYVITECGHCKGTGKCACYNCLAAAAVEAVDNSTSVYDEASSQITYLTEKGYEVTCNVCKGVGKVVFWRE